LGSESCQHKCSSFQHGAVMEELIAGSSYEVK